MKESKPVGMGMVFPARVTIVISTAVPHECWDGDLPGFATKDSFLPDASKSFHWAEGGRYASQTFRRKPYFLRTELACLRRRAVSGLRRAGNFLG